MVFLRLDNGSMMHYNKNPVCSKANFCSANLTSEVLFSLKFLELVSSTEACNVFSSNKTEEFVLKSVGAYPFRRPFLTLLTLSGVLHPGSCAKFLKVQSALPRPGSVL